MLTNEFRTVMQRYTFTHQNRYTFPADNCTIPPLPPSAFVPPKAGTGRETAGNKRKALEKTEKHPTFASS